MQKRLLIFSLLFISINLNAQNLSLDQVISLRPKNVAEVEEFLTSKNWQLIEASEAQDSVRGSVTFAYDKNDYNDEASSFISFYFSENSSENRLMIQITKAQTYNAFMARLKALNYTLRTSTLQEGKIIKVYRDKTLTIKVINNSRTDDNITKTSYAFLLCDNLDYLINFQE